MTLALISHNKPPIRVIHADDKACKLQTQGKRIKQIWPVCHFGACTFGSTV
jgi:hypothetical protein